MATQHHHSADTAVRPDEGGTQLLIPALESLPVHIVQISALVLEGSPRSAGEDPEHTRALADIESGLPPITVHRPTMRVIDGMHRVRAALLRGRTAIEARLIDCDERIAFVLAVQANIAHGLPLTTADRKVAAANIIATHPDWSDRAVAAATGLSDKSVSAIRARSTSEDSQSRERLGRDGRVRPLNSALRRRQAAALLRENPAAALREVARVTGLSPATVRDVRQRESRGEDPVPERYRITGVTAPAPATEGSVVPIGAGRHDGLARRPDIRFDRQIALSRLARDPSVRFSEIGRNVLRWLFHHAVDPTECQGIGADIPEQWTQVVADLARNCAAAWTALADDLERRAAGQS